MSDQNQLTEEARNSTFRLSRRHLLAGAAASTAALTFTELPLAIARQETSDVPDSPPYGTPEATAAISVEKDEFRALCRAVADLDDEDLSDDALEQLRNLLLVEADAGFAGEGNPATGLQELLAIGGENLNRDSLSRSANITLSLILGFLYLGEFNGSDVENRAELYTGLASYQLLPYVATPAICKGAEYWTQEVDLPERS